MKVGIVIAADFEFAAFQDALGQAENVRELKGFTVWKYTWGDAELFAVKSGAGEIHAAAATQMLISKFDVDLIVNFGTCGGLTDEMSLFNMVVVDKVVHYDFDTSAVDGCEVARYPEYPDVYIPITANLLPESLSLKRVICASGDKFVADPALRKELHEQYGAEICEMEAAGVLLIANAAEVPAIIVKVVSDSLQGGAGEYQAMARQVVRISLGVMRRAVKLKELREARDKLKKLEEEVGIHEEH